MTTETELRELDAWIAEHLFGLRLARSTVNDKFTCCIMPRENWSLELFSKALKYDEHMVSIGSFDDMKRTLVDYSPCFTVNPRAAMRVLEKCLSKTSVHVWASLAGDEFTIQCRLRERISEKAPTLPLAICKFARKLFGGEK